MDNQFPKKPKMDEIAGEDAFGEENAKYKTIEMNAQEENVGEERIE